MDSNKGPVVLSRALVLALIEYLECNHDEKVGVAFDAPYFNEARELAEKIRKEQAEWDKQ